MPSPKVEDFRTHTSVAKPDLTTETVGKRTSPICCKSDRKPHQDKLFAVGLLAVAGLAAFLYIELSFCWPQFGRAEVFFAECAREMIEARNWVTPLYHGQGFFDKPILTYWMIIGCFHLFGIDHFVARIPSIIASLATIVVTALACRRAFGAQAALLSAMSLASAFMYIHFSALCMSDSWLVLFDTTTLVALYAGLRTADKRSIYWFLASISLALGFLVKGPVALVLPLGFFACYLLATNNLKTIKAKHLFIGTLTVAAIATPWFVMAFQQSGAEAMIYFFVRENVQRFAGTTYDTNRPIWFMLVSLMTGFAPWSLFLPFAFAGSLSRWKAAWTDDRGRLELYLWMWIFTIIGFFSLSRGKIDYYALPAFPACAAIVGLYLNSWISGGVSATGGSATSAAGDSATNTPSSIATRAAGASATGATTSIKADIFGKNLATVAAYLLSIALVVAGIACASLLAELRGTSLWSTVGLAVPMMLVGLSTFVASRRQMLYTAYATAFGGIILAGTIYALTLMPAIVARYPVLSYCRTIALASPAPLARATGSETKQTARTLSISTSLPSVNARATNVCIFGDLDTWVNEVTFTTRAEPKVLKSSPDLAEYVNAARGNWLIIWEKDYQQLPVELQEKLKIIDRQEMVQKKIVIGAFSNKDRITNLNKLILARTR